jgi:hypothetical protein
VQVSAGNADINVVSGSQIISAPLNLLSNTNIGGGGVLTAGAISNSGNLNVQTTLNAGNIDGTGSVTVAAGKTLTAKRVRQASMTVNGVVTMNPNGTNAAVSRVASLIIAGSANAWTGRVDLNDNSLIVDYAATSPRSILENQIRQGFAGGSWNGNGITSGAAAAAASSQTRTALGIAEASELGVTSFLGQPVDSTALLIRYTLSGDANLDCTVDTLDFNLLAANFGRTGRHWNNGDFNYDGGVNTIDFNNLAANFGRSIADVVVAPGDVIPEPSVLVLPAIALCAARARRHRREAASRLD